MPRRGKVNPRTLYENGKGCGTLDGCRRRKKRNAEGRATRQETNNCRFEIRNFRGSREHRVIGKGEATARQSGDWRFRVKEGFLTREASSLRASGQAE
jgi:hypothetical protein